MKSDFIIALTQLAAERNLSRDIVLSAIEAALISAYKKDSVAVGQNISVKLDPATGDVSVYVLKKVVEQVEDPLLEISLADAQKVKPGAEIDEEVPTDSLPHSAGRIAAQTAKQVVIQRLREAERELVYEEFADKEGEVFTVTIQRLEPKQTIVELSRAEAILPASEQAPYERYRVGQRVKVLLQSIRRSNKGPEIIVSRADKLLLKRLFEMEVPEIYNGSVEIMNIAREAGARSKVAVFAKQDGVDAVGSCVGLRGIRIQNIVNELHGEKIDVVQWNKDPAVYIASALSPSQVMRVDFDIETNTAVAIVPERQLSLAIGKEGQNARLAARLTGWKVDIKSNVEAEAAEKPPAEPEVAEEAPEPSVEEQVSEEAAAAVAEAEEILAKEPVAAEPVAEVPAAEVPAAEVPAAEVLAAEPPVDTASTEAGPPPEEIPAPAETAPEPEPVVAEKTPEELFLPEEPKLPEAAPAPDEQGASIHDLPEDIWSVRRPATVQEGVIRFAEDIDELKRGGGPRRGRSGGYQPRAGQAGGRGRKAKAGRKR